MTSSSKFLRYLLGGLIIGGFWYINRSRPAWEEAVRTIVVFTVIMVAVRMRLRRKNVDVHLVPLVASKAVLVVLAALVEHGLKGSIDHATLIVSIGLGAAVAVFGPLGDHRFFGPLRLTSPLAARQQRF